MKARHHKELRTLFEVAFTSETFSRAMYCVRRKIHGINRPVLGFMEYRTEPNGERHPWMVCAYLKDSGVRFFECRYGKFFGRKWQGSYYTDQHNNLAIALHRSFGCRGWRYYEKLERYLVTSSQPVSVSERLVCSSGAYADLAIVAKRTLPALARFSY